MPLESYFGSHARIHIKDLSLDQPRKNPEGTFDPEEEITEDDWQHVKEYLEKKKKESRDLFYTILCATNMKIVFPERSREYDDAVLKRIVKEEYNLEPNNHFTFAEIKIITPELVAGSNPSYEAWERHLGFTKQYIAQGDWILFVNRMFALFVVNPDKASEFSLNKETREKIAQYFKELLETGQLDTFSFEKLAYASVLFPDEMSSLRSSPALLERARAMLRELRTANNWGRYIQVAAAFKLLCAEKVEVTDKGLEITMPQPKEDFKEPEEPMPEQRKF